MNLLLVPTCDYLHHPVPHRHHYIFEALAQRHTVHVPHFHVSRGKTRETRLRVHEATIVPVKNPAWHYTVNAAHHYDVFSNLLHTEQIDVVVGGQVLAGAAAIRAARKYGVPVVFDLADWFPDSAAAYYGISWLRWVIWQAVHGITRYNLARSDAITTVSPGLVSRLAAEGFSAELITNGVDPGVFRPMASGPVRAALDIPTDAYVLGFAGSVERWYALDDVLRLLRVILEKRPQAFLLVVGGSLFTPYIEALTSLAGDLGVADRVRFTGLVPNQEMPRYIAAMDLCLIPLGPPQWVEIALPNKFFEYSACGKPILSMPIPDVMALGGDHVQFYKDRTDFVRKVVAAIDDPPVCRAPVTEHTWAAKAAAFEALFERVVAGEVRAE